MALKAGFHLRYPDPFLRVDRPLVTGLTLCTSLQVRRVGDRIVLSWPIAAGWVQVGVAIRACGEGSCFGYQPAGLRQSSGGVRLRLTIAFGCFSIFSLKRSGLLRLGGGALGILVGRLRAACSERQEE